MLLKKFFLSIFSAALLLVSSCAVQKNKQSGITTSKNEVLDIIQKVNGYWQSNNSPKERAFWDVAAYHTGNMAVYQLTKKEEYLNFSKAWAEHNEWKGAKSDNKEEWKYSYGETDSHVLFGDWQIAFQTY